MADSQTVHSADLQLDAVAGVAVAARTPQYLCLHTGRPATAANEVAGNSYARQAIANNAWTKNTVGDYRRLANAALVTFPNPSGAGWATNGGCIALWDRLPTSAGAKVLFQIDLTVSFAAGDTVEWSIGALSYGVELTEG